MTTGAEHWEILSDAEIDVFEQIADLHDGARETDLDDMAREYESMAPAEIYLDARAC